MSNQTQQQKDASKLESSVNADDDLFMEMDETIRNHAESLGLDPDDFCWKVSLSEKES